jgi:hypothetical protein
MDREINKPTELTAEDFEKFVKKLYESEIEKKTCFTCKKVFYLDGYGRSFGECDECFFKRIPEKERTEFFKSFFE